MQPLRSTPFEDGTRTGWLYNLYVTSVNSDLGTSTDESRNRRERDETEGMTSALRLLFQDLSGGHFECSVPFHPYFYIGVIDGHESEVEVGLSHALAGKGLVSVTQVEKEDLGLIGHLNGVKKIYLKVSFYHSQHLSAARTFLSGVLKKNASMNSVDPFSTAAFRTGVCTSGFLGGNSSDPSGGMSPHGGDDGNALVTDARFSADWTMWVNDMREYDMKYHVRVQIDLNIHVGLWYDVTISEGRVQLAKCDDTKYPPAMPKICAFDIETTKSPLKFPQPEVDQIYMISYMIDTLGFLIVNREFVSADISDFEYTARAEYEGHFTVFNEPDELHLLQRFFSELKKHRPIVYVTYNGDYFDFPFIYARCMFHGLNMKDEIGFAPGEEDATLSYTCPHLDCFYWVKRDSYLPQGSHGLKAVTRAKLGYDPIEVDPEEMLPLAHSDPQRMAAYSVSDAVSTYYLYLKYVHPFIFSLCTIIPMPPDMVLRKGSGTLCESLLCVQASARNVIYPNKQIVQNERFFEGHLIDSETYIGGRVESLQSGIYRADLPIQFRTCPDAFRMLISQVDNVLRYSIEEELHAKMDDITNYEEVRKDIIAKLEYLRDNSDITAKPMIYHLDVGAMYPNIILTNRLQPYSVVTTELCPGCGTYALEDTTNCHRKMSWIWRGEMFNATRHDYQRIRNQIEHETFTDAVIDKTGKPTATKKTYGKRVGNVLEGTEYERKKRDFGQDNKGKNREGKSWGATGNGYRKGRGDSEWQERDAYIGKAATNARVENGENSSGDSEDENENKKFSRLAENTQFNMAKRRVADYSRRAYGKVHFSREITRTNVVCQKENSFYVDTVRLFRDRRYVYKAELKRWKGRLEKALADGTAAEVKEAKSRCVQMESLQLAHKCILNSFYGYVMRKGSRWYSMEMAGIVTYVGASLIKMARILVQQIGVPLELDTDGIWCCLPCLFPENYVFETKDPKKKLKMSYPCVMLNKDVHDEYTNTQYHEFVDVGVYRRRSECSIYFEVDGPYFAMILPASREEGKGIKKRYAVFNFDKSLAEIKGFELKRRGELQLIKDFQVDVFPQFLEGGSLGEAYDCASGVADSALDMLYMKGEGYEDEEVLAKLTESSSMGRRLSEYPETQKSLALTTARRISEFLGPQMVKDKGLACHFIVSRYPVGRPVTERAIPTVILRAEPAVRVHYLRSWTGNQSISLDSSVKQIIDWDYYLERFSATLQKIVTIPAALQGIPNPIPRVKQPDWLSRRVMQQNSSLKQTFLTSMFAQKVTDTPLKMGGKSSLEEGGADCVERDVEDMSSSPEGSEGDGDDVASITLCADDDEEGGAHESEIESLERLKNEEHLIKGFQRKHFTPRPQLGLDNSFFTDPAYSLWLQRVKAQWTLSAQVRREALLVSGKIVSSAVNVQPALNELDGVVTGARRKGATETESQEAIRRALQGTWHIFEVRDIPDHPCEARVYAFINKELRSFSVAVPWTIIVDAEPDAAPVPHSRPFTNGLLPNRVTPGRLLEVCLSDAPDPYRLLRELAYERRDIRCVYEDNIPASKRLCLRIGATVTVDVDRYSKRDAVQTDFEMTDLITAPFSRLGAAPTPPQVFVFLAVSNDTRALLGAFFPTTQTATVVCVQSAAAQRPKFNWAALAAEANSVAGGSMTAEDWDYEVKFQCLFDLGDGMTALNQVILAALSDDDHTARPALCLLESHASTTYLASNYSAFARLPVLRLLGAEEDERLFSGASTFTWARNLAQRMLIRFFASNEWVQERFGVAAVANVPLCSLDEDLKGSAMDLMFMRALKNHAHVLWDPKRCKYKQEPIEERPTEVVNPTGSHSWSIEFTISQVTCVAVLFSQPLLEEEGVPSTSLFTADASSHFYVLRDLLSTIYSTAAAHSDAAAMMLLDFARWVRDTESACYEPGIARHVNHLVHRALTALLVRVVRLGGTLLRATPELAIVESGKQTLAEAVSFAAFMRTSLQSDVMLTHMNVSPKRYWCPLIVLNHLDYCGLFTSAQVVDDSHAEPPSDAETPQRQSSSVSNLEFELSCTIWNRLPSTVRELFGERLREFVFLIDQVKAQAVADVSTSNAVAVGRRDERVSTCVKTLLSQKVSNEWQMTLIEDVNTMLLERGRVENGGVENGGNTMDRLASVDAAEYIKVLTQFISHVSGCENIAVQIKNNCLRLCGIGAFSAEASFTTDYVDRSLYVRVYCSLCGERVVIYFGARLDKGTDWQCPSCSAPIFRGVVEAHFILEVNRIVTASSTQDLVCTKCRSVSSSLLSQNCCGELTGKVRGVSKALDTMEYLAKLQNMPYLLETVQAALDAI